MTNTVAKEQLKIQQEFVVASKLIVQQMEHIPLAHVHSFGCQQNVSDGEKIKGMLADMGYGFTDDVEKADFVLFNTCAVRENAEDRVFGNVGELKHAKTRNPDMIIAVGGCMVQQEHIANRLKKSFPFVDIIFGTHVLHQLPQMIYNCLAKREKTLAIPSSDGFIAEGLPVKRDSKFKASVPVMYGCNNFCTYCIVPYVRGRERSRKMEDIIAEVSGLVADGYKHITLLGQNVNSYGKEYGVNFSQLLRQLDAIEGEYVISFMTSHPKDCTHELIDTIAQGTHISHHLHLPVQAGSNRILTLMNRGYKVEDYISLVDYAREKIPDLALTTDLIVGFPDEQYDDFKQTLELVKRVRYDSAFTFIYSRRKGTKAAEMNDSVSPEEKGKWFRELLETQSKSGGNSYKCYLGKTVRVLCEGRGRTKDGYFTGKTIQNIIVDFDGDESLIGTFVDVEITEVLSWALIGRKIG